ncbi:MAG: radical SAM protein [Deltaproteobacteria bacterium]|nr:radical SAM protein [Deltaproteobacteria bacterium]
MELTLVVDHHCNLRCAYCYAGDKFSRRMSDDTMRRAIDLAIARRPRHLDLGFFGGEPTLHPDLILAAVEHAERAAAAVTDTQRPTVRYVLNTNGTLLGEPRSRPMLEALSRPRLSAAFVSIDGPRDVHDAHRVDAAGRGSFDRALEGLSALREAGVPFQLTAVASKQTAARLGDTLRTLLPLGATKIIVAPNFRDDWSERDIAWFRAGLRELGDAWIERFRAGEAIAVEPLHAKILSHLKGGMPCPSRCMLGGEELAVAPSGRLYPCAQMVGEDDRDELCIGDVERGVDAIKVAGMQRSKERVEDTCSSCALRDRCQSHCGCRHVALTGALGEITAVLCEIEGALIAEADRVAETLFEEQCPAFLRFYYQKAWQPAGQLTQLRRARGV